MLNTTIRIKHQMKKLLQTQNYYIIEKTKPYSCLCGLNYYKTEQPNILRSRRLPLRVHSTQSDQHRQKVVIETSSPNIIDKLRYDKVLPLKITDEKLLWRDKIDPYIKLARWDKPVGVYLLFWPCSWSIAMGTITSGVELSTALSTTALFLIGAGLMRGAGCTINDMWDKDIDKQVDRTANRPLVTGAVSSAGALGFLAAQLSAALAVLLQLNCNSVALGVSSTVLVITYPLAKRFTNYPQVCLGATFNWGALMGYTAITGTIDPNICVPMYIGALAWTVVYDTIYAHQDKHDDARIGIKSTALTFGPGTKPALLATLALSGGCLLYSGGLLSPAYSVAVTAYVASITYQIYSLDVDNPTDCANKFKANSYIGLIILLGILGGGYDIYLENRQKNRDNNINASDNAKSCFFG